MNNEKDIFFDYNQEKNSILQKERNIGFEDVLIAFENDNILDIIENPSSNFDNQYCYIVEINAYAYVIPFIINENNYFLKTIIPSREYTKEYLK